MELENDPTLAELVRYVISRQVSPTDAAKLGYGAGYDKGSTEGFAAGQEHPPWVYCKDALPDDDSPVLASTETAYNDVRRYRLVTIQSYCDGEWETEDVIAWMPLPEAAKERER